MKIRFVALGACLAACAPVEEGEDSLAIGQIAPWPTERWAQLEPEEVDMDPAVLEGAFEYAFAEGRNTQAVIVIRGGAIVAERYAEGKDETDYAASWSAAKSFASTLVGMSIDDGDLRGVGEPMSTFFPAWAGTDKEAIELHHVLHMESGLDFVEDYANVAESDVIAMGFRDDVLAYTAKEVPVGSAPGSRWYYSSGDTMLLSGAIEHATGRGVAEMARERIFEPLGMDHAQWWVDGLGRALAFCCMDAPPREFAKFGLLFLRDGRWGEEQLVSPQWVETATTQRADNYEGYAYQWWTAEINEDTQLPPDMFAARGHDSQVIYVIPSLDLVVVRFALYDKPPEEPIADGGYLRHFMPRGLSPHGTHAPDEWLDEPFLAPVINAIEGTDKIEVKTTEGDGDGDSGADPLACNARVVEYAGYCEQVHGCACDQCPGELISCDDDPGLPRHHHLRHSSTAAAGSPAPQSAPRRSKTTAASAEAPVMAALRLSDCVVSVCPHEC